MSEIKLLVTRERYEEVVSIDDDMHFFEMTNRQAYDYMIQFCVDVDGNYVEPDKARELFKKIPKKEFRGYINQFVKAVGEAFVNPQSGADSKEASPQE